MGIKAGKTNDSEKYSLYLLLLLLFRYLDEHLEMASYCIVIMDHIALHCIASEWPAPNDANIKN